MYHAGSWLGSCDTFRPRSLSTFIVWAMVISWLLLDLASLPKAESRPLEILLLPSALTLLSDIVSVPWDTDMASWALGQNRISQGLRLVLFRATYPHLNSKGAPLTSPTYL